MANRKVTVTITDLHTRYWRTTVHIVDVDQPDWRSEALAKALSPQRPRRRQFEGEWFGNVELSRDDRWFGQIGDWVPSANAYSVGNRVAVDFEKVARG